MEVNLLLSAELDAQNIYSWMDEHNPRAAEAFLVRLGRAIEQLRQFPNLGARSTLGYRRLILSGFPYALFYKVMGARVMVSAILDMRGDPEFIKRQLRR